LAIFQGFATGLMLSMSFFDLAYDAVNAIGFLRGNLWVRKARYLVGHL
jgi:ZIP family zinc transporter